MSTEQPGAGAPTKYKGEFALQAYKLCLLGLTNEELALFFGVNADTIYEWQKKHVEFSESIKNGKEIADAEVAYKLHERATGFTYDDTDIRVIEGKVVQTPIKKFLPADPTAQIYWLNNRRKINFKARQTDEVATTIVVTTTVTKEEAVEIYKSLNEQC
jgi:hypothetical protein